MLAVLPWLLAPGLAWAADPLPEAAAAAVQPDAPPPDVGLSFLGLLQLRGSASNVVPTNPLLDGQIVGQLGGINGTTVLGPEGLDLDGDGAADPDQGWARGVEQRATGILTYAPPMAEGRAALTAGFEVDFAWGDQAYGVGGNTGGGFGADQVNLQTRRLYGTIRGRPGRHLVTVHAGLQFIADNVHDPHAATPDMLFRTGGGLKFWGSEGAGVGVFGRLRDPGGDRLYWRLGSYTLVEGGAALADDVGLHMADVQVHPGWNTQVGAHLWYLRDNSHGAGGLLGRGPTSALSTLQGGPSIEIAPAQGGGPLEVDADIATLALDAGVNPTLERGDLGLQAMGAVQVGRLYVQDVADIDLRGWLVDGGARWRWAPGRGSVAQAGALIASRDGTGSGAYTGIITGQSYGIAGATWAAHGTRLLFADPGAINRSTPVVADVSGAGNGLVAVHGGLGWDLVPNRTTLRAHGAWASDQLGEPFGIEANLSLAHQPLPFMTLSGTVARVFGARFDADPVALLATADWLLF